MRIKGDSLNAMVASMPVNILNSLVVVLVVVLMI